MMCCGGLFLLVRFLEKSSSYYDSRGGMKISIFGMGYVGAVSGACFARLGHEVIGVDVNRGKIDMINAGGAPVVEQGLAKLMAEGRAAGRISATDDALEAVKESEISLIPVGPQTGHRTEGRLVGKGCVSKCQS